MRSLQILIIFFILSALAGMLLIGYSYIDIADEIISMVSGTALIAVSVLFWFAALWKISNIVAKNQKVTLSPLNLFQMIYRLPDLLNRIDVGQKVKGIDRSLSYAVICLFILLPVSMAILPIASTTVLVALLLGMFRLARKWKMAVSALELPVQNQTAAADWFKSRSSFRVAFETLGTVMLHMLIAFLVTVTFNTFYLVPFEGYRIKVQKRALEDQLSNAYGAASSYLDKHSEGKVTTIDQLEEGGWHETSRIRFVQSNVSKKGGSITLKYTYSYRSRHYPVTGRIISDAHNVRIEMLP